MDSVNYLALNVVLFLLRELLGHLNQEQLDVLEKALCSSEGLGTLEHNKVKAAAARKKTKQNRGGIDAVSHSGSSGRHSASAGEITSATGSDSNSSAVRTTPARRPLSAHAHQSSNQASPSPQRRHSYNLDSRESNSTVFEPLPVAAAVATQSPLSSAPVGVAHEEGVVLEEVEPFPHLGTDQPIDNTLPSAHPFIPPTAPTEPTSVNLSGPVPFLAPPSSSSTASPSREARKSAGKETKPPKKSKSKGPAGFPSVEDMMHRLFLGISGVADQLQTNHAKDLRVILKYVFTVCQTEAETSDTVPFQRDAARTKCSSVNELEPCTPEPQSPLITASSSKQAIE